MNPAIEVNLWGNLLRRVQHAFVLVLAFFLACAPTSLAQQQVHNPASDPSAEKSSQEHRWYIVEMFEAPAGWLHIHKFEKDGNLHSVSDLQLTLGRGDVGVKMGMASEFVETRDGSPVSMTSTRSELKQRIQTRYDFQPQGVKVTTTQTGKTSTKQEALPTARWLPPAAAEREAKARYFRGEKTITMTTIDPLLGLTPITQKRIIGEPTTITVNDKPLAVTKTTVTQDQFPGVTSTEYLDDAGDLIRSETQLAGFALSMTIATESEAKGQKAGGASLPEVMVSTFVKPSRAIPRPRATIGASYKLSVTKGELIDLPTSGAQTFSRSDASSGVVTIAIDAKAMPPAEEADNAEYLASTSMADTGDALIQSLAQKALRNAPQDTIARCELLRKAVHEHITRKDLGMGLGTASQAAKERQGDCTEHAALLVAMMRASNIPARAVTGLLYADEFSGAKEIFGYHMWTQALVQAPEGPVWVDFDAVMNDRSFDATHIAIANTSLSESDSISALGGVASVLGALKIEVLSVSHREGGK